MFSKSESDHLQNFSNGSTVVVCIRGWTAVGGQSTGEILQQSGSNYLLLNVDKTREMATDFRKNRAAPQPLNILGGEVIKLVENYKSLVDSRLTWKSNTETVKKKTDEQTLLPEEAEIFRCVQQDVGHFQSGCCASSLLGRRYRSWQHQQIGQIYQEGWLCDWLLTGRHGSCGGEDSGKTRLF